jgi:hypothetical protein
MPIRNTDYEPRHPWPSDLFIQGGKSGFVIRPAEQGGNYGTAFVECMPSDTFIRGEGPTLTEAEDDCWAKYQRFLSCAGGGEHGPYEPRNYDNGSGFCVKCGMWFNRVCAPSPEHKVSELACALVQERYGPDVVLMPHWRGLVADERARLWAEIREEPPPEPTTVPPTAEELAAYRMTEREFGVALGQALTNLTARSQDNG